MKKITYSILFFFLFVPILCAHTQILTYSIEDPTAIQQQHWGTLSIPGNPEIPYITARILLPFGEEITSISATHSKWEIDSLRQDYPIAQQPYPISATHITKTPPNPDIYASNIPYPYEEYYVENILHYAGYSIAYIRFFPIRYYPIDKNIEWASEWRIFCETSPARDVSLHHQSKMLCNSEKTLLTVKNLCDNPEIIDTYHNKSVRTQAKSNFISPDNPHNFIIISRNNLESVFLPYCAWKESKGFSAGFYSTEDIYNSYTGVDNAEKIRTFIIDAYQTWNSTNTPLEYVLLGGDDEIIPARILRIQTGSYTGNIPSDLYFSALDGNFDENNNGVYGEEDDIPDYLPEIAIGRIPAETAEEFKHALDKIISYTDLSTPSLEIACMIGENLNPNTVTWGGDYKDDVLSRFPHDAFHIHTLYERDNTYSESAVFDRINNGFNIINHMGHAHYSILMGMQPGTADQYTNTDYGFIYTQGCYPAAFDNETSGNAESVAERLMIAESGIMAFVGNTRYGWYSPGSIEGTSQQFDRTFFDGLFTAEIYELGKLNNYSKTQLVSTVDNPYMRWCYYELILFGDPSTQLIIPQVHFPYVYPDEITIHDNLGDNDGIINPGEKISFSIRFGNRDGWNTATDICATLQCNNPNVTILDSLVCLDLMQPGDTIKIDNAFSLELSNNIEYSNVEYSIHISANPLAAQPFNKIYNHSFPVDIPQAHWPKPLGGALISSPIVYDITGNGEKELLGLDWQGNIQAFQVNAMNVAGFPISTAQHPWGSIAIGDMNNDENPEIVFGSRSNQLSIYANDGTKILSYPTPKEIISTPAIADLNHDGTKECVFTCLDGSIHAITIDGKQFGEFPYTYDSPLPSDPAIGDINHDGTVDIIFGDFAGNIHAVSASGEILSGFPIHTEAAIFSSPIILSNGNIAFASGSTVFVINGNGHTIYSKNLEEPITASLITFLGPDDHWYVAGITAQGTLFIINEQGNFPENWPKKLNELSGNSPICVDINNDSVLDIIAISDFGTIVGYSIHGELLNGFPIHNMSTVKATPLIADFDGDHDFEIIIGTSVGISIWDYKAEAGTATPWSMFRGNIQRTGNYNDNTAGLATDPTPSATSINISQNFPNPMQTNTRIAFSLPHNIETANISIYNIKGQLVRRLVRQSGHNYVDWDGKNTHGHPVGNGIYFYKLLTEKTTSSVKRLLVIR